jgi:hypothetical protein
MSKKTRTPDREKYAMYLDSDSLAALRAYQQQVGVPVSESIRRAVEAYVKTLPKSR